MTTKKRVKSIPYQEWLMENLRKHPDEAVDYLNIALEDPDEPTLFIRALRNVADAWSFSHLADLTGLSQESMYKTLSEKGNPKLSTMMKLLDAMGLQLAVAKKQTSGEGS